MLYVVVKALVLPPASLLLLLLAGWVLSWRYRIVGGVVIAMAFVGLWACATPLVSGGLLAWLDRHPPVTAAVDADAIVVLSAGTVRFDGGTPERRPDELTWERLQEAAQLHRLTGLPIVVSGGPTGNGVIAAEPMAAALRDLFLIEEVWAETTSTNTMENATDTARLLARHNMQRILLVTHGWHLPRALLAFSQTPLEVVPAPATISTVPPMNLSAVLPTGRALSESYFAFHEIFGILWYNLHLEERADNPDRQSVPLS